MKKPIALVAIVLCFGLKSEASDIDRSLMSDAYWAIWNDAEQARIDADIERNRKADGVFEVDAPDGAAVRDASALREGDEITARFARGEVRGKVLGANGT